MNIKTIFDKDEKINLKSFLNKHGIDNSDKFLAKNTVEDNSHYLDIETLKNTVLKYDSMYLLVDCDLDGYSSASMIYTFFRAYNQNIRITPILHINNSKAHGLEDDEVMTILRNSKPSLLWISDAGSSDEEYCKELSELGYEIIITDHHIRSRENNYAQIINCQDASVENKDASGCLVTWHLLSAIDKKIANTLISYVMLSLISDNMNMATYENYTFSYRGKQNIHPNLLPYIDAFNNGLTNKDFSFGCISKFNSLIRLGSYGDKIDLFYGLCGERDENIVIARLKELHTFQLSECKRLLKDIEEELDLSHNYILSEIKEKTPLTGLLAQKILSKYNKTTILVHERVNGEMAGSVRSNIDNFNTLLNDTNLFNYNNGHDKAFGTSFQKENTDNILEVLKDIKPSPITVIMSYEENKINLDLFPLKDNLDVYNICGKGIEIPTVHIKPFKVNGNEFQVIGSNGTTIKLNGSDCDYMWFFADSKTKNDLMIGQNIDYNLELIGEVNINRYKGNITYQLIITNYEIHKIEKEYDTFEDLFG